jgi:hypothetical protein
MKSLARRTFLAIAAAGLATVGAPSLAATPASTAEWDAQLLGAFAAAGISTDSASYLPAAPASRSRWDAHGLDVLKFKVTVMEDGRALSTQQLQIHLSSDDPTSASATESQTYESGSTELAVAPGSASEDNMAHSQASFPEHGACPVDNGHASTSTQSMRMLCNRGQVPVPPTLLKHEATFSQVDSGFKVTIRPIGETHGTVVLHAAVDLTQLASIQTKTDSNNNVYEEPQVDTHRWEGDLALATGASTTIPFFHQSQQRPFGFGKVDRDISVVFERLN